jgi:hypothetical protein
MRIAWLLITVPAPSTARPQSQMTNNFPYWPAALRQDQAAAYCGLSVDTFKSICPVRPIEFTPSARGQRYLRERLDAWLSNLDPNREASQEIPRRKIGDMIGGRNQA